LIPSFENTWRRWLFTVCGETNRLTESPEGGWGIAGHANTNADIAAAARAVLESR
jgi:hypothetical protein